MNKRRSFQRGDWVGHVCLSFYSVEYRADINDLQLDIDDAHCTTLLHFKFSRISYFTISSTLCQWMTHARFVAIASCTVADRRSCVLMFEFLQKFARVQLTSCCSWDNIENTMKRCTKFCSTPCQLRVVSFQAANHF